MSAAGAPRPSLRPPRGAARQGTAALVPVLLLVAVGGCGPEREVSASRVGPHEVALTARPSFDCEFAVVGLQADGGTTTLGRVGPCWGHNGLDDATLEVLRLPEGWSRLDAVHHGAQTLLVDRAGAVVVPAAPEPWWRAHWGLGLLFVLLAAYAVGNVGFSGGPNHGEHPLIVGLCTTIAFLVFARDWAQPGFWAFLVLSAAGLVIGAVAAPLRAATEPRPVWTLRAALAVVAIGQLVLLARDARFAPYARWTSPHSLELHVPPPARTFALLGEGGAPLYTASLPSSTVARTLVLWPDALVPTAARVGEGAGAVTVELGRRP